MRPAGGASVMSARTYTRHTGPREYRWRVPRRRPAFGELLPTFAPTQRVANVERAVVPQLR